jgi:thioredoxin reductase (NADPH)
VSAPLDLAVVGAGPCGLAVAIAAKRAGLSTAVFDRGCVANAILDYPVNMTFFSTADRLEIGGVPFICAGDKPTRQEALKYYRRVAQHFALELHPYEEVTTVEGTAGAFTVRTRPRVGPPRAYAARAVTIATGHLGRPNLLGVPGEDLPKVTHVYREAHPYFDQDCVVVGGGNSAVEAALELYRAGARVTLVHFLETLDPGVKPWVRPDIENRLRRGEIVGKFRTRVREIGPDYVVLRHEETGAEERIHNDWVLAMTGWRPDLEFLERLGIRVDPETGVPEHDPATFETNVPGLYIAGVIAAGFDANRIFIENGREHGEVIVRHLAGRLGRGTARAAAGAARTGPGTPGGP